MLKVIIMMMLFTSVFAGYISKGSVTAGESISGTGSSTSSGLVYEFVVPSYGVVEFSPQEPTNNTVQYKIQDYVQASSAGYFSVGGAEGITSHGSLDYPNGWKIQMMPGTYKIIVYAHNTGTLNYSMNTTFTPSNYQSPKSQKTIDIDGSSMFPIDLNQKYYDNIGFYRDTEGPSLAFQNNNDWFSFSLTEATDISLYAKYLNDIIYDGYNSNPILYLSLYKQDTSGIYQSNRSFNTLHGDTTDTFNLESGNYKLRIQRGSSAGSYEFKVNSQVVDTTPTICSINSIWKQKDSFNPDYCPTVQSDSSILLPFAPWTNGHLGDNGFYDGNAIITQNTYNLLGKELQVKFSLDGANNYFSSFVGISDLTTGLPYQYLSTDHAWGPTKLVDDNRAIYYQMSIKNDGTYNLTISYNGYGQSDIHSDSGTLTSQQIDAASNAYIYFNNGDNYGGINANSKLYEMIISDIAPEVTQNQIVNQTNVAKLYVATFNRAPDSAGLLWWTNSSNLTLSQIAQSFFDQPETKALYPVGTSNRDFIQSVYQNLFNREPDTAGWDYWENELNIGSFSKNSFIEAVINGAQGSDIVILTNKTNVGIAFANAGMNDLDDSKSIMRGITADTSTVTTATSYISSNNIPPLNSSNGSNIIWLDNEPDGYFHWQEASDWCTNQGYRLPYMSELIEAWNEGGGVPSPAGFQKDTFYWSADAGSEAGTHKGCAMDYDCSTEPTSGWEDIYSNGHPKCVISN